MMPRARYRWTPNVLRTQRTRCEMSTHHMLGPLVLVLFDNGPRIAILKPRRCDHNSVTKILYTFAIRLNFIRWCTRITNNKMTWVVHACDIDNSA